MKKIYVVLLFVCLAMMIALVLQFGIPKSESIAQATLTITPFSAVTQPPYYTPTITSTVEFPDLCAQIGYRLQSYYPYEMVSTSSKLDTDSYSIFQNETGVYLKLPDETRKIQDEPFYDALPLIYWVLPSPNGEQIAIMSGNELYNEAIMLEIYDVAKDEYLPLPVKLNEPSNLVEWSPDGRYLALHIWADNLQIWDWKAQKMTYGFYNYVLFDDDLYWSPDNQALAFIWRNDGDNAFGVTMAAADGSFEQVEDSYWLDTRPWHIRIFWSGDSQKVVFMDAENNPKRVLVLHRDGRPSIESSFISPVGDEPMISFAADGTPLYWSQQTDGQSQLVSLYGDIILENILRPPFRSPDQQRMVIYDGAEGDYHLEYRRADGQKPQVLIETATDAGNPNWSPDGERVAVVWADISEGKRRVHLRWLESETGEISDFSESYKDIKLLAWSPDGEQLVFVTLQDDGEERLEWLDVMTGEHKMVAQSYVAFQNVIYDKKLGWFTAQAFQEKTQYLIGASLEGEFLFAHPDSMTVEEFPSPDGKYIALKLMSPQHLYHLHLVEANYGNRLYLAENLTGLGNPIWTDDSQYILHTQSTGYSPMSYEITHMDGTVIAADAWYWGFHPAHLEACS